MHAIYFATENNKEARKYVNVQRKISTAENVIGKILNFQNSIDDMSKLI